MVGCINSPAVITMEWVGMENMMIAYFSDTEAATRMLEVLTESSVTYGETLVGLGVEDVFIENGSVEGEMVGPDMYDHWD